MYYEPTKFDENHGRYFWENEFFILCELPLILRVGGKLKKTARDIYMRTLYIEFERDWSIGLGSMIGDATVTQTQTHTHTHTYFSKTHF